MDNLQLKEYKRIAVMGGTFDPVHLGHLIAAEAVRCQYHIEKVIFIPTGKSPHKNIKHISSDKERLTMTRLAVSSHKSFMVSDMEIGRKDYSYTVDTIAEIKAACRDDCEIFFITGADTLFQILSWKDAKTLLTMCRFVAVNRPGYGADKMMKAISDLKNKYKADIEYVEIPSVFISSSDLRQRVKKGLTIKYLVPESVEKYIYENKLYTSNLSPMDLNKMKEKLNGALSVKRFIHTLGVAESAKKLARQFGVDMDKAEIAALLHDCAKNYTHEESLKFCREYGIVLDEYMHKMPELIHPFLGAEVARREYGVEDTEIIDAIKYHTTGRSNMSDLEKIIYIADIIEANRKKCEYVEEVDRLSKISLDHAMVKALKNSIEYVKSKKSNVHPLSIEALAYFKKETGDE